MPSLTERQSVVESCRDTMAHIQVAVAIFDSGNEVRGRSEAVAAIVADRFRVIQKACQRVAKLQVKTLAEAALEDGLHCVIAAGARAAIKRDGGHTLHAAVEAAQRVEVRCRCRRVRCSVSP